MLYLRRNFPTVSSAKGFLKQNELLVDENKTGRFLIACQNKERRLAWSAMAKIENGKVVEIE